ncbi:flagellar M-ring protein FliF [Loktanella sp. IMCC34160]|uniref:flagellar basal-body MS-ring/collar protein FliF n=1 Tax=Loktanella sp. IMCC34160 TaxID=2510646 RepID=UPI00101C9EBB|nr:flagellar basal-body MS-ring/collar protein FliF [Loktanella sp. IMCC34160]RYG91457.1 flagellar M-ring protein FliF [Loktanella sp. IMCC34160]
MSVWTSLDMRKKIIALTAAVVVFAAVLAIANTSSSRNMALLYSGLEPGASGDVVAALEQRGVQYEVRGAAIYVDQSQRDVLRMTLAAEGLPANGAQGYELLDSLSGFGTTSQMFDAAYWRAKEGELARTILSSPDIRSARVHISSPTNRPFAREQMATAAVTVGTVGGTISPAQAKALRYLVASAVSGLSPDNVAVIDSAGGLIAGNEETAQTGADARATELRNRAQRLLEARVGLGNAVVEVSVDTVTETETIVERSIDPDSRVAISTEVEERTNSASDSRSGDVTVASNLPDGDAAGGNGASTNENNESRTLTNFDVSEVQREILRAPGAIRRISVAVLVNEVAAVGEDGQPVREPRSEEELAALRDLVASAIGIDESRGDVITLKSMPFEQIELPGTEAAEAAGLPIDIMSLVQLAVLAIVSIVLGLFVVRPILTSGRAALPAPDSPELLALTGEVATPNAAAPIALAPPEDQPGEEPVSPVERLRSLIEERQSETLKVLQSWIEDGEQVEQS